MEAVSANLADEPGLQADQRLVDRGWLRIGAGVAVAAQAMVFSFASNLSEVEGWAYPIVHGILILSALLTLILLGGDLMRSAWDSVRQRRVSIDLLFLVTLAGAFAGSLVSTFTRAGSVYYEVVAILIVVHTAGKMIGARSRVAALRAVDATREKFEWCGLIGTDGQVTRVRVGEVRPGQRVRVLPGESVSIDATIVAGRGFVQETSMTGEWRPVSRGPGEHVLAGMFSVDGIFELEVIGGPRRLDAILDEVARARVAPSQLQRDADRLMAWFLPLVVIASVATFVFWYQHAPWSRALFNAMAVLLVACPCAMGLATPIAVWSALARMAQFGLVARTGDIVDVLARADLLCIDKTGTLSADVLAVQAWRTAAEFRDHESWLQSAVAAVEEGLAHPIAQALSREYPPLPADMLMNRRIEPGLGVIAQLKNLDGSIATLAVGDAALGSRGDAGETAAWENPADGAKSLHVFLDGVHAATIVLDERWRAGLGETFVELQRLGVAVEVLSGDPSAVAALGTVSRTANAAGAPNFTVVGGLSPAEKKDRVAAAALGGHTVVFVGDGINDAAAMSAAHGSIAIRSGAELARAAATGVFVGEDLRFLPSAIRLARATRRNIRHNLLFAAAYNLAGVALAAAGVLHPVVAALLMVGSSAFVAVNALRRERELKASA